MSKTINIKGAKFNKFTGRNQAKNEETRKNILLAPSLYQMIRDVIIEEETSMKGFASVAIDRYIDDVADMGDKPCFKNEGGKTVNTTIFLPRELAKEIKRTASHAKISENELMVRCLVAGLRKLKDKYPEYINEAIIK